MEIRYVRSITFTFLITVVQFSANAGNTNAGNALAEILALYPLLSVSSSLKCTLASGESVTKKNIIPFLSNFKTPFPTEWVEGTCQKRIPFELVLDKIARQKTADPKDQLKPDQMTFLYIMVEKLRESGVEQRLVDFEQCAYDPQFCLAFLKNSNASFLQKQNGEGKSAIEIVIDNIFKRTMTPPEIPSDYQKVLEVILKQKDYKVPSRILEYVDRYASSYNDLVVKLFIFIFNTGTLEAQLKAEYFEKYGDDQQFCVAF